jgi:cell wall-associated NlpC family hydrolase
VTTCTWNFRRHAPGLLSAACFLVLVSNLAVPRASADQISDLRTQATALAARIQNLGVQEEALSERYDAGVLNVQTLQGKVAQAAKQVAAASAQESRSKTILQKDAINAYVQGGANALTSTNNPLTSANDGILRAEYANSLATDQTEAIDQYHAAALQHEAAKAQLQQETSAAQAAVQQVSRARQAVSTVAAELQGTLNQDRGRIAVLVAQQQAAAEAAAEAAARARLAAQQAAQRAAVAEAAQQAQEVAAEQAASRRTQVAPTARQAVVSATELAASARTAPPAPAPVVRSAAPPRSSGALGAMAAAESRVGDRYLSGAAGPTAFDCSGLVVWAFAQVGISLPHYSGAQYADTTHISMSNLEPGDLVFYADPGQHVAIYIGGGRIVEAANPAAGVRITALYPQFVLASRVG